MSPIRRPGQGRSGQGASAGGDPVEAATTGDAPAAGDELERALVRRAQSGDEDAFRTLVERHGARLLRVVRNLVPDRDEADDLAQEAWMRVFRSLDRFDEQYGFATWLHRIGTNLAIDWLRRRRPVREAGSSDPEDYVPEVGDDQAPAPSEGLEVADTAREVRDCVARLAPHFHVALVLREIEGLSCAEIARITGATEVTVRWRLHRGRKLFQDEWERRERWSAHPARPSGASGSPEDGADSERGANTEPSTDVSREDA